jgi:hypothetical protein
MNGDTIKMPRITHPPPTIASAGAGRTAPVSIGEDCFVPDSKLERWVRTGAAVRTGTLLTTHDGRRFLLRDGVRIIGRRNGESDPYGLTGKVETLRGLLRQGATVSACSVRLGSAVYDIEHGYVATLFEAAASTAVKIRRVAGARL